MNSIEEAFANFNQASEHLTEFYKGLENQVALLNDQLQTAHQDKLREYEEKERLANRLANILHVLPGGLVVLDGDGRVADCNPAAKSLLGEPLEGEQWRDIVERCFAPRWDDGHDITLRDGRYVSGRRARTDPVDQGGHRDPTLAGAVQSSETIVGHG